MNASTRRSTPLAALLAAGLSVGVLSACGSTTPTASDPAATGAASSTAPAPSTASMPTDTSSQSVAAPAPSASDSAIGTSSESPAVTVPVYFVLRTPKGPRLVQEPTSVAGTDKVAGAVQALQRAPKDPDYATYYHPGDLGAAHFDGSGFTVTLTNKAAAGAGTLSAAEARLAVQQLVYTLEAAQGAAKAPVTVVAGGASTPLFGVPTANGVKPADQLDTLADMNILTPADGSAVSGTLVAGGLANSPEANVTWKITDAHGKVVKHGFATATGWMDKLYPWQKKIDLSGLPAGDYTLIAATDDEADQGEGPGATSDTKTFTVS